MSIKEQMNRAFLDGVQHPSFAPYRHHVGLEFTTASGEKISDYQLLNENVRAVAIADFVDGILLRSGTTPAAEKEAFAWVEYCKELQVKNKKKVTAENLYDFS